MRSMGRLLPLSTGAGAGGYGLATGRCRATPLARHAARAIAGATTFGRFGDRQLDGPPDRPGLVLGFLELAFRNGAGDDARADVEVDPVVAHDRGADRDGGVEVAVVAEIADGAAVQAAPLPFRFGDELHRSNLRRTRKRPRREDASQRVEGVESGLHARFHVAHEMEDVAVALDLHVLGHRHRPGPGHPAEVVAAQIDEHDVLRPLLWIALECVGEGVVLGRGGATRPGSGDRMSRHAVALDTDEKLRAGAHDRELRHPNEEQVRAGVDPPQRPIQRHGIETLTAYDRALEGLAASDDDLDGFTRSDGVLGGPYRGLVLTAVQTRLDLPQALRGGRCVGAVSLSGLGTARIFSFSCVLSSVPVLAPPRQTRQLSLRGPPGRF